MVGAMALDTLTFEALETVKLPAWNALMNIVVRLQRQLPHVSVPDSAAQQTMGMSVISAGSER